MPAARRRKVCGPIGQTKSQQSVITFSGTKAGRRTITSDEKAAKAAKAKIISEAEEEVTTAPPPQTEPISIIEPESTAPIEGADLDDDQSLRMRPRLTFHSEALDLPRGGTAYTLIFYWRPAPIFVFTRYPDRKKP